MPLDRLPRPLVCLVTDRHRLPSPSAGAVVEQARAAARAGVTLIQVRERDLPAASLAALVGGVVAAVGGTQALVVVNERADVALAAGAHGVHLRGDSAAASRVRAVSPPGWIIGRSVHTADEAREVDREGAADYLLFGTVFPTSSKPPGHPVAGLDALRAACASVSLPVLAIGGMTVERLGSIAAAGAAGVAAIGLFAGASGPGRAAAGGDARLAETLSAVRRAFDT
jgi:thiamine-phosphate pyrophosphorylase